MCVCVNAGFVRRNGRKKKTPFRMWNNENRNNNHQHISFNGILYRICMHTWTLPLLLLSFLTYILLPLAHSQSIVLCRTPQSEHGKTICMLSLEIILIFFSLFRRIKMKIHTISHIVRFGLCNTDVFPNTRVHTDSIIVIRNGLAGN